MTATVDKDKLRDNQETRKLAELLKDTRHRDTFFNSYLGVALSAYMNGINDAAKSFRASQPN